MHLLDIRNELGDKHFEDVLYVVRQEESKQSDKIRVGESNLGYIKANINGLNRAMADEEDRRVAAKELKHLTYKKPILYKNEL